MLGYLTDWTAKTFLLGLLATWFCRETGERIGATRWPTIAAVVVFGALGVLLTGVGALISVPGVVALGRNQHAFVGCLAWISRLGPHGA